VIVHTIVSCTEQMQIQRCRDADVQRFRGTEVMQSSRSKAFVEM